MKKKILFISPPQFGYQIDYFNYCKYLIEDFDITYICYDYGQEKIINKNVNIIYVRSTGKKFSSKEKFLRIIIQQIKSHSFDIVFVYYFIGCSFLPLLQSNQRIKFILDIRSGCVTPNKLKRSIIDSLIKIESVFFDYITIISEGLRKKLYLAESKTFILPLGCDPIATKTKKFSTSLIHLLYVGTFNNRNIQETILGFNDFLEKNPNIKDSIIYTIIGTGSRKTVSEIENLINDLYLSKIVQLKGYIKITDLLNYYENANIGISYVPITKYFDNQPPTKTYEYLQAGMPVIATATKENKRIINKKNGVLIQDNYLDFSEKLGHIINNFTSYDSTTIRKTVENNTWKKIISELNTFLKSL